MNTSSNKVKPMLKNSARTPGNIRLLTAPIPAISAPIFMMMAGKLNKSITYSTQRG